MGVIRKLPIEVATSPRDGEVMTDRYWVVDDDGLYWHALTEKSRGWSPQCNSDERITVKVLSKMYPDARVEFIPDVYVGHSSEEWGFNPFRRPPATVEREAR